jgi:hypothetical protein
MLRMGKIRINRAINFVRKKPNHNRKALKCPSEGISFSRVFPERITKANESSFYYVFCHCVFSLKSPLSLFGECGPDAHLKFHRSIIILNDIARCPDGPGEFTFPYRANLAVAEGY